MDVLIPSRTLQGLGGGVMTIVIQLVIAELFPIQLRAKYYGLTAVVWAIASGFGPILDGTSPRQSVRDRLVIEQTNNEQGPCSFVPFV